MAERKTQISALAESLTQAGVSCIVDFDRGTILLEKLPEFRDALAFSLHILMEAPKAVEWTSLFDDCALESGRIIKGAAHGSRIYSRKAAMDRAKQEKWAAMWALYDAGILSPAQKPVCETWQDMTLP